MTDDDAGATRVLIERSFDAPIDLIWRLWTDPEHFKAWYGPAGAVIPIAKMDVRVGGARLVCMEMTTPNGPMQMWFAGEYLEVVENQRLRYTETMSDEHGNPSSPPGMPDMQPVTTEVRVELEFVDGRTQMLMTQDGIPADSPATAGWSMAFDKLDAYAETIIDSSS